LAIRERKRGECWDNEGLEYSFPKLGFKKSLISVKID